VFLETEIDEDANWTWEPIGFAAARVILDCADQMGCDTSQYREEMAAHQ